MNELEIKPFATWEVSTGLVGTFKTPLILLIEIQNKTNRDITIDSICLSIKTNYLLFNASSDEFKLDVIRLFEKYSDNKKFKVKVTSKDKIFESEIVHLGALKVFAES